MSVTVRPQKHLLYFAFNPLLLVIGYVFIFSQENLKRAGLVSDPVHAVDFEIHPAVKRSSADYILKFELTSRIRIFLLTNSLVDFRDLESLTPYFTNQSIELLLRRIFREGIVCVLNVLVEIKLPMLVLVLYSPLNNTHVTNRGAHYRPVLKDFD